MSERSVVEETNSGKPEKMQTPIRVLLVDDEASILTLELIRATSAGR
jgi:hypothetical protein